MPYSISPVTDNVLQGGRNLGSNGELRDHIVPPFEKRFIVRFQ